MELKPCPQCKKSDKIGAWICGHCGAGISVYLILLRIKDADKKWNERPINKEHWNNIREIK